MSCKRLQTLTPLHVLHIPPVEEMQEGVLYVSREFGVAIHLCACGCRSQAVTPFDHPQGWELTETEEGITLHPSIGMRTACKAHYWVRKNSIVWC